MLYTVECFVYNKQRFIRNKLRQPENFHGEYRLCLYLLLFKYNCSVLCILLFVIKSKKKQTDVICFNIKCVSVIPWKRLFPFPFPFPLFFSLPLSLSCTLLHTPKKINYKIYKWIKSIIFAGFVELCVCECGCFFFMSS